MPFLVNSGSVVGFFLLRRRLVLVLGVNVHSSSCLAILFFSNLSCVSRWLWYNRSNLLLLLLESPLLDSFLRLGLFSLGEKVHSGCKFASRFFFIFSCLIRWLEYKDSNRGEEAVGFNFLRLLLGLDE